jgi:hypothetical protein
MVRESFPLARSCPGGQGGKEKAKAAKREKLAALAELDGVSSGCIKRDDPHRVKLWVAG